MSFVREVANGRRYGHAEQPAIALCLLASFAVIVPQTVLAAPVNAASPRVIKFETTEGTWMDVDVSPDGQTIVFNILGDIYQVGISGGRAERLTSGSAYDY